MELWKSLGRRCEEVNMGRGRDQVECMLTPDKQFILKSLYRLEIFLEDLFMLKKQMIHT